MSEYREVLPGTWMVQCLDKTAQGCSGPMHMTSDGVAICELHARARKLIPEPEAGGSVTPEAGATGEEPPGGQPESPGAEGGVP